MNDTQTATLNITVREAGEDLYARPYVVEVHRPMRWFYVRLQEYWPMPDGMQEFYVNNTEQGVAPRNARALRPYRFYLWWNRTVRRLVAAFGWYLSNLPIYGARSLRDFGWQWRMIYPLWATQFPNICFSLDHQLQVEDPDHLTDTCYLIPSSKYLLRRIESLDPDETYEGELTSNAEAVRAFREWRATLEPDEEICFVVELNS